MITYSPYYLSSPAPVSPAKPLFLRSLKVITQRTTSETTITCHRCDLQGFHYDQGSACKLTTYPYSKNTQSTGTMYAVQRHELFSIRVRKRQKMDLANPKESYTEYGVDPSYISLYAVGFEKVVQKPKYGRLRSGVPRWGSSTLRESCLRPPICCFWKSTRLRLSGDL